jgi:hypothetical protein
MNIKGNEGSITKNRAILRYYGAIKTKFNLNLLLNFVD